MKNLEHEFCISVHKPMGHSIFHPEFSCQEKHIYNVPDKRHMWCLSRSSDVEKSLKPPHPVSTADNWSTGHNISFLAVVYHFAKRHERDTALSSEHHGMIERGESDATGNRVIDDVLLGIRTFQAGLGLDSLGFGNELGCELIEVFGVSLKGEAECPVRPSNGC